MTLEHGTNALRIEHITDTSVISNERTTNGKMILPISKASSRMDTRVPKLEVPPLIDSEEPPLKTIPLNRENILKERSGIYGFAAKDYRITLDDGSIAIMGNAVLESKENATFTYRLSEVRVGSEILASGGKHTPVADPIGRNVTYQRGTVQERYVLGALSVEQDFVITELPSSRGDIMVTGAISTNLTVPVDGLSGHSLSLSDQGKTVLTISDAIVKDSDGRSLQLSMTLVGDTLSLIVPAHWVADASLPIVIDPVITMIPIVIDPSVLGPTAGGYPSAAYSTSSNRWLITWSEQFGASQSDYNVYGQFLDRNGNLAGSAIAIATTTSPEATPVISFAPASANRWLIAWAAPSSAAGLIQGCVLNGDGTVYKPVFPIADLPGADYSPQVAFDGTNWHVSWANINGAIGTIRGRFVSTTGTVGANADVETTGAYSDAGGPFFKKASFGAGKVVFIWANLTTNQIFARTITPAGLLSAVATVGQGVSFAYPDDVSVGSTSILFLWHDYPNGLHARVSNLNLSFITGDLIMPGSAEGRAGFSSTNNEWLVTFYGGKSGVRMNQAGAIGAVQTIVPTPPSPEGTADQSVIWNPNDNTMLIVYHHYLGSISNAPVEALIYNMLPPPLSVTATPSDSRNTLAWPAAPGATSYMVLKATASIGPYFQLEMPTTNSFIDIEVSNGTTYFYKVASYNAFGRSAFTSPVSVTPVGTNAVTALLVVGNTTLNTGDAAIKARLEYLGYTVVVKADAASTSGDATGKALVAISSTVTSGNVNTKFTAVARPVLNCEPSLMSPLGMTGGASGTNFGTLAAQSQVAMVASNSSHPLATGLVGTVGVLTAPRTNTFTFGQPNANATRIATLTSDSSRAVIWGYETNSLMPGPSGTPAPGLPAPARRVGLFLNDSTAVDLSSSGFALFDAAVRWAAGAPMQTVSIQSILHDAVGHPQINWQPVVGATSYRILRSTLQNGIYNQVASGVSGTSFIDTGASVGQTYFYIVQAINIGGRGPLAVGFLAFKNELYMYGRTGLRTWTGQQTTLNAWNVSVFTAIIRTDPNYTLEASAGGEWAIIPAAAGVTLVRDSATQATLKIEKEAVAKNFLLTYTRQFHVTNTPATKENPVCSSLIFVDQALALNVVLRFPYVDNNNQKRSGRTNVFSDTPAVRDAARNAYVTQAYQTMSINFNGQANPPTWTAPSSPAWEQANLGFYITADLNYNEKKPDGSYTNEALLNQFPKEWIRDESFIFQASDEGADTSVALSAQADKNKTNSVNVYFVPHVGVGGDAIANAWTLQGAGSSRRTIFIGDDSQNPAATIAHEVGHCLGVKHPDQDPKDESIITHHINNPLGIFFVNNPNNHPAFWYNLMWGNPTERKASYLTDKQATTAYNNAKAHSAKAANGPQ